mmetsp:Transcript_4091/g.18170  ORF Transcript_4091/g.18170 Transcript_4091/m.18170 type:complete len:311 (+) Transcript_4091:1531-2463(+)
MDLAETGPTDPKWHPYRDPSPSASASSPPPPACWSDDAVRVVATPPEPDTIVGIADAIDGRETRESATPDSPIANAAAAVVVVAVVVEPDSSRGESVAASVGSSAAAGGPVAPQAHATLTTTRVAPPPTPTPGGASSHLDTAEDTRRMRAANARPKRHQHRRWGTSEPRISTGTPPVEDAGSVARTSASEARRAIDAGESWMDGLSARDPPNAVVDASTTNLTNAKVGACGPPRTPSRRTATGVARPLRPLPAGATHRTCVADAWVVARGPIVPTRQAGAHGSDAPKPSVEPAPNPRPVTVNTIGDVDGS